MTRTRIVKGTITEKTGGNEIYFAEGNIVINAGEKINITSGSGISFNEPDKYNPKDDLLITKIDGPYNEDGKKVKNIDKGERYSYRITQFNRTPKEEELKLIKWGIQFDEKPIVNTPNVFGSKIAFFIIPKNAKLSKFNVYAFIKIPSNSVKVNVEVNNIYYRFNPLSYAKGNNSSSLNSFYVKREIWGAQEPLINTGRSFDPYCLVGENMSLDAQDRLAIPQLSEVYFGIAIHHSGNNGIDTMTKVQDEHVNGKNEFADVGYHFGIDLSGKVYEGRYIGVKGSHLTRYNTGIIGIVFLADFDHQWWDGDDDMTHSALVSVITLIKGLQEQFTNINVLGGHKEWKNNVGERSCPGEYGMEFVKALRNVVGMKSPKETGHG